MPHPRTRDLVVVTLSPPKLVLPLRQAVHLPSSKERFTKNRPIHFPLQSIAQTSLQVSSYYLCVIHLWEYTLKLTCYFLGLYAPREGQAYRERQRRQFSQFDRGTSLAQSELAAVSSHLPCPNLRNVPKFRPGGSVLHPGRFHTTIGDARKHNNCSTYSLQNVNSLQTPNFSKFYSQAHYDPSSSFERLNLYT